MSRWTPLLMVVLAIAVVSTGAATIESPSQVERSGLYEEKRNVSDGDDGRVVTPPDRPNRSGSGPDGVVLERSPGSSVVDEIPLSVWVGIAGMVLVGSVVAFLRATRGGDDVIEVPESEDTEPSGEEPSTTEVGRIAGRAADRLDSASGLENEIYRAWNEMTEHLDVENPDASTPGEFAAAAVAAGMDPTDVTELTELFEQVRYGDGETTAERERRARGILRRIESAYSDERTESLSEDGSARSRGDEP